MLVVVVVAVAVVVVVVVVVVVQFPGSEENVGFASRIFQARFECSINTIKHMRHKGFTRKQLRLQNSKLKKQIIFMGY